MSPIHDHAGSSCWVKCLEGELQEVLYSQDVPNDPRSPLSVISDRILTAEKVAYINDTIGLHRMGNPSSEKRCVTMHIYCPPYKSCNIYDQIEGLLRHVPVTTAISGNVPIVPTMEIKPQVSLPILMERLNACFKLPQDECQRDICNILDNFTFPPEEWANYIHFNDFRYSRCLLGYNSNFTLFLLCWNNGQGTPAHRHTTKDNHGAWIKVLSGVLQVVEYPETTSTTKNSPTMPVIPPNDDDPANRIRVLSSATPTQFLAHNFGTHRTFNPSQQHPAISLALYSPPYLSCVSSCGKQVIPSSYCSANVVMDDKNQICAAGIEICNIPALIAALRKELIVDNKLHYHHDNVYNIIKRVHLNLREVSMYSNENIPDSVAFMRHLVCFNEFFSITVLSWAPRNPGNNVSKTFQTLAGWVKVLSGSLTQEEDNAEASHAKLGPDDIAFSKQNLQLRNGHEGPTLSLHIELTNNAN